MFIFVIGDNFDNTFDIKPVIFEIGPVVLYYILLVMLVYDNRLEYMSTIVVGYT